MQGSYQMSKAQQLSHPMKQKLSYYFLKLVVRIYSKVNIKEIFLYSLLGLKRSHH